MIKNVLETEDFLSILMLVILIMGGEVNGTLSG